PSFGLKGDDLSVFCRRDVCNNPAHRFGYGVFTGAPEALEFLVAGSVALDGDETVLLATDGMDLLFESPGWAGGGPLDPEELIRRAEDAEADRPDIRSDD